MLLVSCAAPRGESLSDLSRRHQWDFRRAPDTKAGQQQTPADLAAIKQGLDDLNVKLEKGQVRISPRHWKLSGIALAAAECDKDKAAKLLNDGVKPGDVGEHDVTALHLAARCEHTDVARVLLEKGANPNSVSKKLNGLTPLAWAVSLGRHESIDLLLAKGADPNLRDERYGLTPLMVAVQKGGRPAVIESLLKNRANPDLTNKDHKMTALMIAAASYDLDAAALLLKYNANRELRDFEGLTALDLAKRKGYAGMVALLEGKVKTDTSAVRKDIALKDEFDDELCGWFVADNASGAASVRDGKYVLENRTADASWLSFVTVALDTDADFIIETRIRRASGPDTSPYGVIFAGRDVANHHQFVVNGNGQYNVSKFIENQWYDILPYTAVPHVVPGAGENTLRIERKGGEYLFFVNGNFVNRTPAVPWAGSKIGFKVYGPAKIEVDYLTVSGMYKPLEDDMTIRVLDDTMPANKRR
jgi:hypothetical protein